MTMTPVIVLAFSNDKDNYLEMIVRERKNIFELLRKLHDNKDIQVDKEENTSIEDLFKIFNNYNDRIVIFHYGGHANGAYLQLEKGAGNAQLAHANGLAGLLGQQKNLKLVFLNGCATQGQVEMLLQSGVKAVIATSVPINDEMAVDFSEQFYAKLASNVTIQEAFNTAKALITTKYGFKRQIDQYRDMFIAKKQTSGSTSAELPWGIYYNEANKAVLNWKISENNISKAITEIRNKIALSDTNSAIQLFQKLTVGDLSIQNKINLLSGNYQNTRTNEMMGLIPFSETARAYAIVNFGLLNLLAEYEESLKNK
jgi:hypothetical protein